MSATIHHGIRAQESQATSTVTSSPPPHLRDESEEGSESESGEEDESESDEDEDDDDDNDDEGDNERLRKLLARAKMNALEREGGLDGKGKGKEREVAAVVGDGGDEGEGKEFHQLDEVRFEDDDEEDDEESEEEGGERQGISHIPTTQRSKKPNPSKATTSSSSPFPSALIAPLVPPEPVSTRLMKKKKVKSRQTPPDGLVAGDEGSSEPKPVEEMAAADEPLSLGKDKWGELPKRRLSKSEKKSLKPNTAGPNWFDLPSQPLTPFLKREIQALNLRNSLDPTRHYRSSSSSNPKNLPEFFQMGHIISSGQSQTVSMSGTDDVGRARDRKRSFVDELMGDEGGRMYAKRKFEDEVLVRRNSGRGRGGHGGRVGSGRERRKWGWGGGGGSRGKGRKSA